MAGRVPMPVAGVLVEVASAETVAYLPSDGTAHALNAAAAELLAAVDGVRDLTDLADTGAVNDYELLWLIDGQVVSQQANGPNTVLTIPRPAPGSTYRFLAKARPSFCPCDVRGQVPL